ncbi:hypothetical protein [Halocatena halophila]|uniref:hypothetical protein n=1 Tax=Halocatena halophila TaxID=2814576 RepID=UPI002ED63B45
MQENDSQQQNGADSDERIVSARNPELARQMEELRLRTLQADDVAKRAIELVDKQSGAIEELREQNEALQEQVAMLKGRVTPDPATKDYDELTRDERVHRVRTSCVRKASKNGGRAAIDYNDVMTLLGHHPSTGYAYKLLKLAGELAGFTYEKRERGKNDRLCVDLNAVTDETVLHAVNNREDGGA